MKTILAIGGGHIGETINGIKYPKDSKKIYSELVYLSKKKNPKILFIPTASSDSKSYCEVFSKYLKKFNCKVDFLLLYNKKYSKNELTKKVMSNDIIYVGGGNTLKMINKWKQVGLDKILIKAYNSGKIMSGISAGAICWFKYGNSDSRKFKNKNAKLIKVRGINLVNALYCPHYNSENDRKPQLKEMTKKIREIAISCDNCCAIEIINNEYRIISSKKDANAYKCYWKNNIYYETKIIKTNNFKPLRELIEKN